MLNLSILEDTILWLKDIWRYLGFIFDGKLSFHQHISSYSNKAFSTIKSMKILGNSTQKLLSINNNYSIEYAFFLLHSMNSLCSSSKMPYFCILLKNSEKSNGELPSRSQILSVHHLLRELRPSPVSSPSIYTLRKSVVDINFWCKH